MRTRRKSKALAPPDAFRKTLQHHLENIGWRQIDLVKHSQQFVSARISRSQLSGWLNDDNPRSLTRSQISRLAFIIFDGYKKRRNIATFDPTYLEVILGELLESTGFSLPRQVSSESAWERIERKELLRVGYVPVAPLVNGRPGSEVPEGPAVEITYLMSRLMGVQLRWIPETSWAGLLEAVAARRIDIVCPILVVLPARMWLLKYSRSITNSEFQFEVAGLVDRSQVVNDPRFKPVDEEGIVFEFDNDNVTRDFSLSYVRDEAAQSLAVFFAPYGMKANDVANIEEGCRQLLQNSPIQEDRIAKSIKVPQIRCFLGGRTSCCELAQKYRQLACIVRSESKQDKLPVAFAAHADEVCLIEFINQSLNVVLDDQGRIPQSFLSPANSVRRN